MRALKLAAVVVASLAVAGCNTVAGAGQDITAAGKAVTHTAEDIKR